MGLLNWINKRREIESNPPNPEKRKPSLDLRKKPWDLELVEDKREERKEEGDHAIARLSAGSR
jgi:hypothetical protein